MNIYVGNLSREVTEEDLRQAFEVHGQVSSIAIIKDRVHGHPKGIRIRGNAHSSRGPDSDRQPERHGARGKCTQGQRGSPSPQEWRKTWWRGAFRVSVAAREM